MAQEKYGDKFTTVKPWPADLEVPLKVKKPTLWFVNSMSDLLHENLPIDYIREVFDVMNRCPQHTFQVLTKRGHLLAEYDRSGYLNWSPNIWMGVSVESPAHRYRIDQLRGTGAQVKFLSLEPLLSCLPNLDLRGIHWVIVGGESGRKPRPMDPVWVEDIRQQCEAQRVAFFFKQWGGKNKKEAGRILNGRTYDEMPQLL